ncbi:GIDE domain-containing protein [Nannocystis sp. ILAH1]|uniref:GIDE domain-containing protein n=1 Tax=unclassified Nannocystis TaxID=2627009 RepID=UPI00226E7CFD|nr:MULTISPECIES: GIDE domain-containing protein [unclassified Nannocystis]MCY0993774.1 GIDE domain-containing protein [Nannocystis sp. ILAH1]MCY1065862.1 GIDE domain-containing protein [Nannocystis sp. RBIL2]
MPVPIFALAAAAIAGVGLSYALSTDARTRRSLKKRPVTPIRGLREGELVRVRGRVLAGERVLEAPLSHRPSVYYLATVDQETGRNHWREVAREERFVEFAIDDGTGRIQVIMSVPRVAVVSDHHTRSGSFDDASEVEEAFLRRHGLKSTNLIGLNIAIRYDEGTIEPGEEVTAFGLVRAEIRDGQRVLVLDAPDDGPLLLSDDPRAVHG